jgi:predicted MFS family arabinose efflux permease
MDDATRRRSIGFLNFAHAVDHFVLLIFPTVVIGMEAAYGRPYSELIVLSTASFVAFGVFSLPAGWLADRWSRRAMMAVFYFGSAGSLAAAALAPNFTLLAVALFALGVFAAIYHPVGMAMLIEQAPSRGRTLAFNGVCGNLGVSLAAAISAALASGFGWRAAFLVPAVACAAAGALYLASVPDDGRHAGARKTSAELPLTARTAAAFFGIYIGISLTGGLVFNTLVIALPKIVDERLGWDIPLIAVGGLTTLVFLCGAASQLMVGRLVERVAPSVIFVAVAALQLLGTAWAGFASGAALMAALAVTVVGIYAQVTVGDLVLARYTADAWRGRVYAVRYFLTFLSAGAAVPAIAFLHARGGFDGVLTSVAAVAAVMLACVLALTVLVAGVETRRAAVQPAE